jgi:hypothetical protein
MMKLEPLLPSMDNQELQPAQMAVILYLRPRKWLSD